MRLAALKRRLSQRWHRPESALVASLASPAAESGLATTMALLEQGWVIADASHRILQLNAIAEDLTGLSAQQAQGMLISNLLGTHPKQQQWQPGMATVVKPLASRNKPIQVRSAALSLANGEQGSLWLLTDMSEQQQFRDELAVMSELLERTSEMARVGGWELDLQKMQFVWSRETRRIHELDDTTEPNIEQGIQLFFPEAQPIIRAALDAAIHCGIAYDLELPKFTTKGRAIWVRVQGVPVFDAGRVVKLRGAIHDITERKTLEIEKDNERKVLELLAQGASLTEVLQLLICNYESLFREMWGSVLFLEPNAGYLHQSIAPHLPVVFSQAIEGAAIGPAAGSCGTAAYTGKTVMVADIATDPLWRNYRDLALAVGLRACWSVPILTRGERVLGTFAFYSTAVRAAQASELAALERGAGLASLVIEHHRVKAALEASLTEKVALLHEVHHRVKNNLQVISSLLRMEARRSNQAATQSVLADMNGRIRSMALLHELLYQTQVWEQLELASYIKQIVRQVFRIQAKEPARIKLVFQLDAIHLSMDQATSVGLLVNELVSNCLKHAFPDGRTGEIRLQLRLLAQENLILLEVSDTGIGLPDDLLGRQSRSLGLQLVSDLIRQLDGVMEIHPQAHFCFKFPVKPLAKPALAG